MEKFYQQFKLGVLGGGQLGRMLIQSAIDFNIDVHIIDPSPNAPCANIATSFTTGDLQDFDAVYNFGKNCDVVTIEIEKVNTEALKKLRDEGVQVFPEPEAIEMIQDKRIQKTFYKENNIPTSPFILIDNKDEIKNHTDFLPAVNKLGKDGYDGRGVQVIKSESDIEKGFDRPGLLEKFVDFEKELAVIVAKNSKGEIKAFPPVELVFHPEANLVEYLFSPADISPEISKKAEKLAMKVIDKVGMTGLLAVEMFLTSDGEVLVNEIAPRTHNSGHQTIEGNTVSQYEQHLRAILGMPLGDTDIRIPSAMVNLLGEEGYTGEVEIEGLDDALATKGVHFHLYGKKDTKPFRKMGHITVTDVDIKALKDKALKIKSIVKIKSK
ncbi:5-(carboxyamino)imidazole ribonucleotide synthase [Mangrovivirga cuniculi]|uniref:N5-carboxyaminoimidazole ribonucleotide synthase n=1 Tax=Mangrovivirga cuniculi TaxID=2715131 RepID=A0A4D7JLJ3_9BACT|nr:5-(carboxyamino)imidazole ribonucleotide synthase [Mangrovivirga cuniculi]QCK13422.1 5-(carboxyamino)imidazole ribonucleotide synthase [Mangrovivirga cuniculi]